MKNIAIFALLILALHTGCSKDVNNIVLPPKKIIVNAQISPADDSIKVILNYSQPINTSNDIDAGYVNGILNHDIRNLFAGATVTLSDGVTTKTLKRDAVRGLFFIIQADFKLIPGKTYQLYVKDNNDHEVTAQTQIPYQVTDAKYTFLSKQPLGSYDTRYSNRFEFSDHLNALHFYRLYSGQISGPDKIEELYGNFLENGKTFTGAANIVVQNTVSNYEFNRRDVLTRKGYFISCSNEYFQFYSSLDNLNGRGNQPDVLEQPVNLYTNIKGGLGIFAGYNTVILQN